MLQCGNYFDTKIALQKMESRWMTSYVTSVKISNSLEENVRRYKHMQTLIRSIRYISLWMCEKKIPTIFLFTQFSTWKLIFKLSFFLINYSIIRMKNLYLFLARCNLNFTMGTLLKFLPKSLCVVFFLISWFSSQLKLTI